MASQSQEAVLNSVAQSGGRHLRRRCGHCDEELSYSAYRSHRSLFYIDSERRWLRSDTESELSVTPFDESNTDGIDDVDLLLSNPGNFRFNRPLLLPLPRNYGRGMMCTSSCWSVAICVYYVDIDCMQSMQEVSMWCMHNHLPYAAYR